MFAILFGLSMGWILLEIMIRVAFGLLPYPVQVILRPVHRHPFTTEPLLPEPIWFEDQAYQLVARPNVDNELHFPDPRVGFHISTKNWLDPNSQVGFRVPDLSWEPQWPVDGVVVGDSFTFCYTEYEDCWVRQLETDHGLSMVNLGLVATGSLSKRNVLNTFGLPYQPRFVIWQWYGNDFNDDYGVIRDEAQREAPVTAVAEPAAQSSSFTKWLNQKAAVYHMIATVSGRWSENKDLETYTRFQNQYYVTAEGSPIGFGQPYILAAFDLTQEKTQLGQAQTEETLQTTKERLAAEGIPWVIVLIPSKEEVYGRWTAPQLGPTLEQMAQGRHETLAFCTAEQLHCLDTTAVLQQAAERGEQVFYTDDTHLTPRGNEILTTAVWAYLVEEGFVEE